MFKRILLAWDGSDHSIRAANKAIEIAKCTEGSRVEVVYVKDTGKSKNEVLENWNSVDIRSPREEKVNQIERMAKESNIQYQVVLLKGEPAPAILEYTNKHEFDVVVVGSRGLNALQEMVLGSVSHKIAKHANCPVMIVK
jgi:nucleotide-binding universal stress UspA family protein